ncbi:MAG: hypothetical protein PUA49_03310 [Butyrivibrio sp.]|nr:hypothetical protein [Butyrivibrio sp.]
MKRLFERIITKRIATIVFGGVLLFSTSCPILARYSYSGTTTGSRGSSEVRFYIENCSNSYYGGVKFKNTCSYKVDEIAIIDINVVYSDYSGVTGKGVVKHISNSAIYSVTYSKTKKMESASARFYTVDDEVGSVARCLSR